MSIRNANPKDRGQSEQYHRWRRKADQEWDMAGLARQDGDMKDAALHTDRAREYEELARLTRQ